MLRRTTVFPAQTAAFVMAETVLVDQEALDKGAQPLRAFMLRQTREADLALFKRVMKHHVSLE